MAHARGYLSSAGFQPAIARLAGWKPALLFCLFAAFAQAQPAAPQLVRFTVFAASPATGLAFTPRAGAAPQKIAFYPTARSPRYEYRGAMPLRFADAATGAVVAEATVPPEIREPLLLFSAIEPAPAAGLRYRVAVLDDSALAHAAGTLAIVNLSGLALGGTVGTKAITLQPGLNSALPIARSAPIALRTTIKERTLQSYAHTVQRAPRQRALLLLFPSFYKGSHEVQSRLLLDDPSAAAAPPGTKRP